MARRAASRFLVVLALIVALLGALYGLNELLESRGRLPLIGTGGDLRRYLGHCSALGLDLPVPCWLVVAVPLVLLFIILAGGRD